MLNVACISLYIPNVAAISIPVPTLKAELEWKCTMIQKSKLDEIKVGIFPKDEQ